MAELFAILRGVERKFGKIKEFRISTVLSSFFIFRVQNGIDGNT